MAKELHLIVVGKLKDAHLESIESDYHKRISGPSLSIHEVKASAEDKSAECEAILKKAREISPGQPYVIALTEWGDKRTSVNFSKWLEDLLEKQSKIIFVIAGAEGFSDEFMKHVKEKISLSELTFPHKLARILFVEQIYRAQTIRNRHPYHN